jgi:hypothetical protein
MSQEGRLLYFHPTVVAHTRRFRVLEDGHSRRWRDAAVMATAIIESA